MNSLEKFSLNMEDDDRERLWERAKLPFNSEKYLTELLEYIDPGEPESNRVRIRNQFRQQTDVLPLDLGYPVIDLAVNQTPFETVGLDMEEVEETVVDGRERVKLTGPVRRTIRMLPVSEANRFTNVAESTVKRWRTGNPGTIPLDFWNRYTDEIEQRAEQLDVTSVEADLLDHKAYHYGNRDIEDSAVAEGTPLEKIARFGHLLESGELNRNGTDPLTHLLDPDTTEPEGYVIERFLEGADPEFFQTFRQNTNYFVRRFSRRTPYTPPSEINSHIEEWHHILEEIGKETDDGLYVPVSDMRQLIDTVNSYGLDSYSPESQEV